MSCASPSVTLRDSEWAMILLNYTRPRRSAFWQFVYSNGVPYVRVGARKIMFNEQAVADWIARRSVGGVRK
jgi:hypothetical protein